VDDVCEMLVKPATISMNAAYSEIFKAKDASFVGRANVFVSHAWLCKIEDLITALKKWLDSLSDAERMQSWYFWIDVFVCNQQASSPKPFDWWRETFKQSVQSIGRTVVVMTPWQQPTYTKRAWCLFEFYITLQSNIPYSITMSAGDQKSFEEELMNERTDVISNILRIDIDSAVAKYQVDKDNIMKCMQDLHGGKERVNRDILHAIRQWVQTRIISFLDSMPEHDRVLSSVQIRCAYMNYHYFKKSAEAEKMILESLEARRLSV